MRIVIAEDSASLREGPGRLLTGREREVMTEAPDADALVRAVVDLVEAGQLPDAVVTGARMSPAHSDEGARVPIASRAEHPGPEGLVLSRYIEGQYTAELLAGSSERVGYPLTGRVAEVGDFVDAVVRKTEGGTARPGGVAQLPAAAANRTCRQGSPTGAGSAELDRRGLRRIRDRAAARGGDMARWRSRERHLLENGALPE